MKIGIDISQIVYQTGVSRYLVELVKQLVKIDSDNQYCFYAGSLRQKPTLRAFVNLVKTPRTSAQLTSLSPKLAALAWNQLNLFKPKGDFDLFHASNWALPRLKTRLITTIHDLSFLKFPQTHTAYLNQVHRRHLKLVKKHCRQVIAVSQSTKHDLLAYGFKSDQVSVIYEAADSIFRPADPAAVKLKYNLTKPYLLCVATLEPRKNLKNLLQAFSLLKLSDLELVLVGKFGWGETLPELAKVKTLGFIPDEDLAGLYSGAKAFVYPSFYEGFGLPVLEALSCGCPVITSNNSSLPEIGGEAAIYINPQSTENLSQAIKQLIQLDDSNHQTIKQKSLLQAKKFSWEKTARETLKLYQEVSRC
ncbi:MAG: glycosyltransferase family 1 protein [Candidatus Beckwithbacteria bacterium]